MPGRPSERDQFLKYWQNDATLRQVNDDQSALFDLTRQWPTEDREIFYRDWQDDDALLQAGRGEKRSIDEVNNDGAGPSDEVSDTEFFTVTNVKQVQVKKFRTTGIDYGIRFHNIFANLELSEYHTRLHEIFQTLLDTVTEGVPMRDQVRFVLRSPQLEYPISLPFLPRHKLTTERILAEFERVIHSNHEFRLNDSVNINLIHVEMPNGGTGTKRSQINLEKHLVKKNSVIRIQNTDDTCLARALVVSIAKIENQQQYKSIVDHRRPMQERLAYELHQNAGVPVGSCGLEQVKQFQAHLVQYQINIVSKEHQNTIIYSGPDKEKRIYLFLHNNHYDVITSMPAFLARKMYCHACNKGYDKLTDHLCPDSCKACRFPNCPIVTWIRCADCKRNFKSLECFQRHKQNVGNVKSICSSLVKCDQCHTVVKRGRPGQHNCGLTRCTTCNKYVQAENHQCYMQPGKERPTVQNRPESNMLDAEADVDEEPTSKSGYNQLLFFDFECRQEKGKA